MDLSTFTDYIQPELLILIPVLYLLGMYLKSAEWINDKHIPVCLGLVGIFLSAMWVLAIGTFTDWQSVLLAIFTAIVQGFLVSGGAVYTNNIYKQNSTKG